MKQLVIGSLLAAVAAFVFGAAYWMGPAGRLAMSQVPDDDAAQAAIASAFPESGSYVLPQRMDAPDQAAWEERHQRGPLAVIHVQAEGAPVMRPGVLLRGFLHSLAVAFLLAFFMLLMRRALPSYRSRVVFAALVGLLAMLQGEVSDHVWWLHSSAWSATVGVYTVLVFTVMGLVLAAFVKPRQAA